MESFPSATSERPPSPRTIVSSIRKWKADTLSPEMEISKILSKEDKIQHVALSSSSDDDEDHEDEDGIETDIAYSIVSR